MQRKRGFTLVEAIVVVAILITLVSLLWPAFSAAREAASSKSKNVEASEPPQTHRLWTVQHDDHWWVMSCENFLHHPDCPCSTQNAEKEDR